jgi:hypothetical protein
MNAAPYLSVTRTRVGAVALLASILLAACSATSSSTSPSTGGTTSPTATATPTVAASANESIAATESASAGAVTTVYDPCQLVTAAEASTLGGASFSAGQASSTPDGGKLCNYSAQGVVVEVLVGQSVDAATAQAQEPAFKADLENGLAQAGIASPTLTELPGFETGVDAAVVSGSATIGGITASAIAIYALKGAVFLAISDVTIGGTPPTSDEIQAQAHTSLGRIQ